MIQISHAFSHGHDSDGKRLRKPRRVAMNMLYGATAGIKLVRSHVGVVHPLFMGTLNRVHNPRVYGKPAAGDAQNAS